MSIRPQTPHSPVTLLVTGHFNEGRGYATWRDKGTNDWLLIYTLAGRGRFGHPGGELLANAGDMVLLRPGTPHDYGIETELRHWELLWTHFHPRPHWLAWLDWPAVGPGLLRLHLEADPPRDAVMKRFFDCHHLARGAGRRRQEWAMNALEQVFLLCDELNPLSTVSRLDARVRDAMEFMCRNLSRDIMLADVADAAGLSVSRLAHLFRREAGSTPQQYLERQRLERAARLMELTSLSLKQIAGRVGFSSPYYFSLRFKRWKGISPTRYRADQERISASPESGS